MTDGRSVKKKKKKAFAEQMVKITNRFAKIGSASQNARGPNEDSHPQKAENTSQISRGSKNTDVQSQAARLPLGTTSTFLSFPLSHNLDTAFSLTRQANAQSTHVQNGKINNDNRGGVRAPSLK